VQDPERFLLEQSIQVPCVVHPDKQARIESQLRAWVNHELYYFSDDKAFSSFRKDPLKYCGLVTDPVTRRRFRPDKRSPRFSYKDRPYYFSSDSTLKAFEATPDSFATPSRGMMVMMKMSDMPKPDPPKQE
jgi:YHS domain-containing protein